MGHAAAIRSAYIQSKSSATPWEIGCQSDLLSEFISDDSMENSSPMADAVPLLFAGVVNVDYS